MHAITVWEFTLQGKTSSGCRIAHCALQTANPEEAIVNVQDAILTWIEGAEELGRPIPEPSRKVA
jgi:predicted RNase H-like HicB family nuclease